MDEFPLCGRCGVDVPQGLPRGAWCQDCRDVEEIVEPVIVVGVKEPKETDKHKRYHVTSSRRTGKMSPEEKAHIAAEVDRLTQLKYSANEIALKLGITDRTVTRYRAKSELVTPEISSTKWRKPQVNTENLFGGKRHVNKGITHDALMAIHTGG